MVFFFYLIFQKSSTDLFDGVPTRKVKINSGFTNLHIAGTVVDDVKILESEQEAFLKEL